MAESRIGTCQLMCPLKEIQLREREGLLHKFEIDESTKKQRKPKANPAKVVKSFNRPAAGRSMPNLSELRPGPVLLMTVRYLFTEIAIKKDVDWIVVYDFIFDRLRAIRQDMVIQRLDTKTSICIYEKIVRFHIYSEQRLCERHISQYDPVINMKHLMECMEQLILLYEDYEKNPTDIDMNNCKDKGKTDYQINRTQMESFYILLRLGQKSGLNRGLTFAKDIRETECVQLALKISCAWYLRNYVQTCKLLQLLPTLLKFATLCNLKIIRREALMIMSSAYNSKNLTFPSVDLKELLLYKKKDQIEQDCSLFNLPFKDEQVHFQKAAFNASVQMANPEMMLSDKELHDLLPNIILE